MSTHVDNILAEGVLESIYATTPHSRHRNLAPRISLPAVLAWAAVAALALITLAVASAYGT